MDEWLKNHVMTCSVHQLVAKARSEHGFLRGRCCALCGRRGKWIGVRVPLDGNVIKKYCLAAHHNDYSRPFDVIYFCGAGSGRGCHRTFHGMITKHGIENATSMLPFLALAHIDGTGQAAALRGET